MTPDANQVLVETVSMMNCAILALGSHPVLSIAPFFQVFKLWINVLVVSLSIEHHVARASKTCFVMLTQASCYLVSPQKLDLYFLLAGWSHKSLFASTSLTNWWAIPNWNVQYSDTSSRSFFRPRCLCTSENVCTSNDFKASRFAFVFRDF